MRPANPRPLIEINAHFLLQLCAVASMIFIGLIVVGSIGAGPRYAIEALPTGATNVAVKVAQP